jgi:hypothetical protein
MLTIKHTRSTRIGDPMYRKISSETAAIFGDDNEDITGEANLTGHSWRLMIRGRVARRRLRELIQLLLDLHQGIASDAYDADSPSEMQEMRDLQRKVAASTYRESLLG